MTTAIHRLFMAALLVTGAVFLTAAGASAQGSPTPPTSCSLTFGGTSVSITTGDGESTFPERVDCPEGGPFSGTDCLRWRYNYNATGGTLKHAGVTVDSDVQPVTANSSLGVQISVPGVGDSELGFFANGVFDVRTVRFNGSTTSTSILGSVTTSSNASVGTSSALARVGNLTKSCAIAGPSTVATPGVGKLAFTVSVIDQAGDCLISRTVDGAGCTIAIDVLPGSPEGCFVETNQTPLLSGVPLSGQNCAAQSTFGTGTKYCYTSTFGRLTCITSP